MRDPSGEWDVVVLGGINTDYLIRGDSLPRAGMSLDGDEFLEAAGGKGANAAVAAARLGARTALIGRVGNDVRSRRLVEALTAEGVHVAHVAFDDVESSGAALIQVDRRGRKQILAALGANLHVNRDAVDAAADTIRAARVLVAQLEVPVECVSRAAVIASNAGVRILLDPAPPRPLPDDLLRLIDVIRANATEVKALTGVHVRDEASAREGASALLASGARAAMVEAGSGNLLVWPAGEARIPELPVRRVDSTGAGDAFTGGLAVALAEGLPLADAARFASGAAALATTALGAQTALPSRRELNAYLQRTRAS